MQEDNQQKVCNKCNRLLQLAMFHKHKTCRLGRASHCKECRRSHDRNSYRTFRNANEAYFQSPEFKAATKKNSQRLKAKLFLRRDKRRLELLRRFSNGTMKCARCGYDNPKALVLDHVNDDGAAFRRSYGRPMSGFEQVERAEKRGEKVREELQVLCANCNVIKEAERKQKKRIENPYYSDLCSQKGLVL